MNDPTLSVVIPVRNEEGYIRECLDSVFACAVPADRFEVVVADGMSGDGTGAILIEYASRRPNLAVVANPRMSAAAGLNVGIRRARGRIVARVDGHTVLDPGYLETALSLLDGPESPAALVGGRPRAAGRGAVGKAIASATETLPGNGGAAYRAAKGGRFTDTVQNAAFRRDVFERCGGFREDVGCDEDEEFNFRALEKGERIFLTGAMTFRWYCRESFPALFRQYFFYGFYKPRVLALHPGSVRLRHAAPPALTLFMALCAASLAVRGSLPAPAWFVLALYAATLLVFSFLIGARRGALTGALAPAVYVTMHAAYGSGFLAGVVPAVLAKGGRRNDRNGEKGTR
ncbi:MAG: glycosyltransferase family 2 protein [bacterium]